MAGVPDDEEGNDDHSMMALKRNPYEVPLSEHEVLALERLYLSKEGYALSRMENGHLSKD